MSSRFKASQSALAAALWKNYAGTDDPLTNPLAHVPDLQFHSTFDYYAAASGFPADFTVNHVVIAADAGTTVGPVTSYDTIVENDYTITAHGLAYVPNFMCSSGGVQYPAGCPIQLGQDGARRAICFWADATNLYVRESCRPSIPGLPAISMTYHVTVFRSPASVAGKKLLNLNLAGVDVSMGYGRINLAEHTMREPDAGETTYIVPAGETMDIKNGRARFALNGGSSFDIGPLIGLNSYAGSFFGGAVKVVAI